MQITQDTRQTRQYKYNNLYLHRLLRKLTLEKVIIFGSSFKQAYRLKVEHVMLTTKKWIDAAKIAIRRVPVCCVCLGASNELIYIEPRNPAHSFLGI